MSPYYTKYFLVIYFSLFYIILSYIHFLQNKILKTTFRTSLCGLNIMSKVIYIYAYPSNFLLWLQDTNLNFHSALSSFMFINLLKDNFIHERQHTHMCIYVYIYKKRLVRRST